MTGILKIQQRPPIRGGLASVAAPLETDDWKSGVQIQTTPDGDVFVWNPLCADDGVMLSTGDPITEKPVDDVAEARRFYPITVGKIVQCGPGSDRTAIGNIALQQAKGSLDRQIYKALAHALHGALETHGNYAGADEIGTSIGSEMVVPAGFDPDAPGNLRGTLQGLLDSVCACSNSDPIFHVPLAWKSQFIGDLVRWDEATQKYWFANHEVSFDCYPNEDPTGTYATNPDGSEVWIFATARPLVEIEEEDTVVLLTRELNNWKARVERHAIVAFDPTCVYGAKATVN